MLAVQDSIDEEDRVAFERLLAKRLNRIPLQHITGTAPFRRIELKVGPGVFIPRPVSHIGLTTKVSFPEPTSLSRLLLLRGELPIAPIFLISLFK